MNEIEHSYGVFAKNMIMSLGMIDTKKIGEALKILEDARFFGRRIYVAGNGGSASTAQHFTADLAKTALPSEDFPRLKAFCLNDNVPLQTAWINDNSWDDVYFQQLKGVIEKDDVLIVFSVHGGRKDWSNNLAKAVEYAKSVGAKTIGFAGFDGGALKELCDVCIMPISVEDTSVIEPLHCCLAHFVIFVLKGKL